MSDINLLNGREFLRFLWRKLTSMRTAIYLLILLAIASIPGSIYPQRTQEPLKVAEYFATHKKPPIGWIRFISLMFIALLGLAQFIYFYLSH